MKRFLERLQIHLLYLDYGPCRHRIGSSKTDHHFRVTGVSSVRFVYLASCFDGCHRTSRCLPHALL